MVGIIRYHRILNVRQIDEIVTTEVQSYRVSFTSLTIGLFGLLEMYLSILTHFWLASNSKRIYQQFLSFFLSKQEVNAALRD